MSGPPSETCWTESMKLRRAIGCRSRRLCWGNVCLRDWTVPWVYVNWAPCNHTQTHMINPRSQRTETQDYPRCPSVRFPTKIEIDFSLYLSLPLSLRLTWLAKHFTNIYRMTSTANFDSWGCSEKIDFYSFIWIQRNHEKKAICTAKSFLVIPSINSPINVVACIFLWMPLHLTKMDFWMSSLVLFYITANSSLWLLSPFIANFKSIPITMCKTNNG